MKYFEYEKMKKVITEYKEELYEMCIYPTQVMYSYSGLYVGGSNVEDVAISLAEKSKILDSHLKRFEVVYKRFSEALDLIPSKSKETVLKEQRNGYYSIPEEDRRIILDYMLEVDLMSELEACKINPFTDEEIQEMKKYDRIIDRLSKKEVMQEYEDHIGEKMAV